MKAAAKRREAAMSPPPEPQMVLKLEDLKHAPCYNPQFFDSGTYSGPAFNFDTLLTYSSGHANQNNNASSIPEACSET